MKLNTILNSLREMNYIDDRTKIQIVLTKGRSLNKNEQIFECHIPIKHADRFFGELEVVLNQIRKCGEFDIPTFWFLLSDEET